MIVKTSTNANHDEITFQLQTQRVHQELVASFDLAEIGNIDDASIRDQVRRLAFDLSKRLTPTLTESARLRLTEQMEDEIFGLGPLEPLLDDDRISDILVNGPHEVYVEQNGKLILSDTVFADDAHVLRIIQRMVSRVGRRVDEVSPMVDARLADGSRINAVIPPLAIDGPKLSIRRFGTKNLNLDELVRTDSLTSGMAEFLKAAVAARISFLISGGTGAGKTTLLDALSVAIPDDERVVTVEDSAELILQNRHVVRMETRPPNIEGRGAVTQRELVRNSLRMRPDRILVGEVRGSESLDMLQAMNTGHEGSLTTIHANDTHDALSRLEMMVAMNGFELPIHVVRTYIATGIKMIVHLARLKGGARRVMRISEIAGVEDGQFQLRDVVRFNLRGVVDEVAVGDFQFETQRPICSQRIADCGIHVDENWFVNS